MIQPILVIFLILPIILGILSVDINGNRFSIREAIKDNFMTEPLRTGLNAYLLQPLNKTDIPDAPTIVEIPTETDKKIDEITSQIADGVAFLFIQAREFGIWMGMATAPFHYLLAVVIGFSFLYPIMWLFIIGFFYITIAERKEIRREFHDMRVRKKVV